MHVATDLIGGLVSGINLRLTHMTDELKHITKLIPLNEGPKRKDAVLLTPSGQWIVEGFLKRIDYEVPKTVKLLEAMTQSLATSVITSGTALSALAIASAPMSVLGSRAVPAGMHDEGDDPWQCHSSSIVVKSPIDGGDESLMKLQRSEVRNREYR